MIEFTLSRVALAVAGIAILATVVPIMATVYDERVDTMTDGNAERIASVFDAFAGSPAECMVLNMGSVLPCPDAEVTFCGPTVEVTWGGKRLVKGMRLCEFEGTITVSSGDYVKFTKEGGKVTARVLSA